MKKLMCSIYLIFATVSSLTAREAALAFSFETLLPDFFVEAVSPDARPEIESQVFHLVNDYRASQSLPLFQWSSLPAHYARKHSLDMARKVVPFGHDGFTERFNLLKAAMPSLSRMGENVAMNRGSSNPAQVAVDGWLSSPGHLANIRGDYNLMGIGVGVNSDGEYFFTQILVKANPTAVGGDEMVSFGSCMCNPVQIEVE